MLGLLCLIFDTKHKLKKTKWIWYNIILCLKGKLWIVNVTGKLYIVTFLSSFSLCPVPCGPARLLCGRNRWHARRWEVNCYVNTRRAVWSSRHEVGTIATHCLSSLRFSSYWKRDTECIVSQWQEVALCRTTIMKPHSTSSFSVNCCLQGKDLSRKSLIASVLHRSNQSSTCIFHNGITQSDPPLPSTTFSLLLHPFLYFDSPPFISLVCYILTMLLLC